MKVNEILHEVSFHTHPDHYGTERDGFKLAQDEEHEDDNIKIFHYITSPDGKKHLVDHNPYEMIDQATLDMYIAFYKKHQRFPDREDIHSRGPLRSENLKDLVDTLEEAEEPRKANESTVKRLASQMVRTACKNFDGDRELTAAKQMARDFHKRLVSTIEAEYKAMKLEDVAEGGFKLSLTEVMHPDHKERIKDYRKERDTRNKRMSDFAHMNDDERHTAIQDAESPEHKREMEHWHNLSKAERANEEELEHWKYDPDVDGFTAQCPKCHSREDVHMDMGAAGKERLHAEQLVCDNCGNKGPWMGPHGHVARHKYGPKVK